MHRVQAIQHAALVGGFFVKYIDIRANHLRCAELRQILADVGLRLREHLLQRLVGIDDVVFGIGDHDVGGH